MKRRYKSRVPVFISFVLSLLPLASKAQLSGIVGDSVTKAPLSSVVAASREGLPAAELIQKVIDHKSFQSQENDDYRQYRVYRKTTISLSDLKPEDMSQGIFRKMPFLIDRMEVCPVRKKLIIPVSMQETVLWKLYRKHPESEKTIVLGARSSDVRELSAAQDGTDETFGGTFDGLNIYDNDIDLLQTRLASPISDEALSFYQYFVLDTVRVGNDLCHRLFFRPVDPQAIGFTGQLYITADSTYAVRKCTMNLSLETAANSVKGLDVAQTFVQLADGRWVLKDEDMIAEIYVPEESQHFHFRQKTSYSGYLFDEIPSRLFKLKGSVIKDVDALARDDVFWEQARPERLTDNESNMSPLLAIPFFRPIISLAKLLIDGYVKVDRGGKFELGPIGSSSGYDSVEGWRLRVGGRTTANLHPQLFMRGYYAYGFRDQRSKYQGEIEYSFLEKEYQSGEFPKHSVTLSHTYDLANRSDWFMKQEKDNVFVGIKANSTDQMSYIRESLLKYEQEMYSGFSYSLLLKNKNDQPAGSLAYVMNDQQNTWVEDITTSEVRIGLRYAPGETFVNTREGRIPLHLEAPVFSLSHTVGFDLFLGGEYRFHSTEVGVFKRFRLSSWGKFDVDLRASKQWNKAPFPLLITPETNLSYIIQRGTYNLVNNLEFLGDRYASMELTYDMNGKLFGCIPALAPLKWREVFKFRAFTGGLSEKNDPTKTEGLFLFPSRNGEPAGFAMQSKPYMEASFGIHNIFKLIHIEYVRRLSYLDHPNISKFGIRVAANLQFK